MLIKLPKEFTLAKFGFSHSEPNDFVKSQWQHGTKSLYYVIYRWFVAILFIANITLSLEENKNEREWKIWAIYLTRWGLVLNVFTNFLAATLVTLQNYNVRFEEKLNASKRLPIGIQIYWVLHSIIVTLAVLITIVYWLVVHQYGTEIVIINIFNHIINSVILIIDMIVVRHPHRVFHFIYVQLLVVIFLIFSFIYYNAGGLNLEYEHAIYPILDWTNVRATLLISVAVLVVVAVIHVFVHLIYRLRIWIYNGLNKDNSSSTIMLTATRSVTIELDNPAYNAHM